MSERLRTHPYVYICLCVHIWVREKWRMRNKIVHHEGHSINAQINLINFNRFIHDICAHRITNERRGSYNGTGMFLFPNTHKNISVFAQYFPALHPDCHVHVSWHVMCSLYTTSHRQTLQQSALVNRKTYLTWTWRATNRIIWHTFFHKVPFKKKKCSWPKDIKNTSASIFPYRVPTNDR